MVVYVYCLFISCRNNFLNVDVYFAQLKYQSVQQIKAYDLVQFMGNHFYFLLLLDMGDHFYGSFENQKEPCG